MIKIYFGILAISFLAFIACENDTDLLTENTDDLLGYWVNGVKTDSIWTYEKKRKFQDDYGFAFEEEQNFIERKNSGWCGTPPIAYGDFDGTWEQTDSIIKIEVAYWGGMADYEWKIISLDKNFLSIYKISSEIRD